LREKTLRKLRDSLSDRTLITGLIARFIITFGAVLIAGGLCLIIVDVGDSARVAQTSLAAGSAVSIFDWIPGIPFYVGDLANVSLTAIGLVLWILGVDFLLVGLGLWVRHRLARLAALMMFGLAAFFQFVQFLLLGVLGSPVSVIELFVDGTFAYLLFSRANSKFQGK
jgi:hypothetical protein